MSFEDMDRKVDEQLLTLSRTDPLIQHALSHIAAVRRVDALAFITLREELHVWKRTAAALAETSVAWKKAAMGVAMTTVGPPRFFPPRVDDD